MTASEVCTEQWHVRAECLGVILVTKPGERTEKEGN